MPPKRPRNPARNKKVRINLNGILSFYRILLFKSGNGQTMDLFGCHQAAEAVFWAQINFHM